MQNIAQLFPTQEERQKQILNCRTTTIFGASNGTVRIMAAARRTICHNKNIRTQRQARHTTERELGAVAQDTQYSRQFVGFLLVRIGVSTSACATLCSTWF